MRATFDCTTGQQLDVPSTPEEEQTLEIAQLERAAVRAAARVDAAREGDLAIVRAAAVKDPAFAALARLIGLDPVGNGGGGGPVT